jgi:hypothetical protein
MQPIEFRKVVRRNEPFTIHWGGGGWSIDVGLLNENHHKINLIVGENLLLTEGVIPFLWIKSYTTSLRQIDLQSIIVTDQKLVLFLKCSCILLMLLLRMARVVLFYAYSPI